MTQDWSMQLDTGLTAGVRRRRVLGWLVDLVLISIIMGIMWFSMVIFGVLTLGLGLPLLGLLPIVPFLYHTVFMISPMAATPGQALMGLMVVRHEDLGPPTLMRAAVSTIGFYLTLALTSGLLLLVALVTTDRRTLHDLVSGLVVVRAQRLTGPPGYWNMASEQRAL